MTVHMTEIGGRVFYINETKNGSFNYNSYNEKTNKTFHYSTPVKYYRALKKAKELLSN